MGFVWWFVALAGVVQIVVESGLFEKARAWVSARSSFLGQLVNCPLCFGVWVGGIPTLLGFGSPALLFLGFPTWMEHLGVPGIILARLIAAVLDGASISFVAMAWTTVRKKLSRPEAVPLSRSFDLGPAPWEQPMAAPPGPVLSTLTMAAPPAPPSERKPLPCSVCPSPSSDPLVTAISPEEAERVA